MQSASILLIDDDRRLAEMVGRYLGQAGFSVQVQGTARAGLEALVERTPDLILLDLMLPGADGVSLCRELRAHSDVRPQACRRPACPGLHRLVPACRGACRERACTWTYPAVAPRCMGAGWT